VFLVMLHVDNRSPTCFCSQYRALWLVVTHVQRLRVEPSIEHPPEDGLSARDVAIMQAFLQARNCNRMPFLVRARSESELPTK